MKKAAKKKAGAKKKTIARTKSMAKQTGAWAAPIDQTPSQYLAAIDDGTRRADMEALHRLIRETVPSLEPYVSTGMIGYGSYHYRYTSGREGDCPVIGLSSRAQYISLYVMGTKDGQFIAESYRAKLPKANIGKSCVRFKRLDDVDRKALEKMIGEGARAVTRSVRTGATAEFNA